MLFRVLLSIFLPMAGGVDAAAECRASTSSADEAEDWSLVQRQPLELHRRIHGVRERSKDEDTKGGLLQDDSRDGWDSWGTGDVDDAAWGEGDDIGAGDDGHQDDEMPLGTLRREFLGQEYKRLHQDKKHLVHPRQKVRRRPAKKRPGPIADKVASRASTLLKKNEKSKNAMIASARSWLTTSAVKPAAELEEEEAEVASRANALLARNEARKNMNVAAARSWSSHGASRAAVETLPAAELEEEEAEATHLRGRSGGGDGEEGQEDPFLNDENDGLGVESVEDNLEDNIGETAVDGMEIDDLHAADDADGSLDPGMPGDWYWYDVWKNGGEGNDELDATIAEDEGLGEDMLDPFVPDGEIAAYPYWSASTAEAKALLDHSAAALAGRR